MRHFAHTLSRHRLRVKIKHPQADFLLTYWPLTQYNLSNEASNQACFKQKLGAIMKTEFKIEIETSDGDKNTLHFNLPNDVPSTVLYIVHLAAIRMLWISDYVHCDTSYQVYERHDNEWVPLPISG